MSIYTVNGNPVKYGNKWLATDGGTPSGELPPYDSSDAGKALVVNNEGDNVEWQTVGSSITVDQHYDSSSSNAQSGTAVAEAISTKQDTISDLSDIRSGAAAGATAVQPADLNDYVKASDLAAVATSGSYNDLIDTPTIPTKGSLMVKAGTTQKELYDAWAAGWTIQSNHGNEINVYELSHFEHEYDEYTAIFNRVYFAESLIYEDSFAIDGEIDSTSAVTFGTKITKKSSIVPDASLQTVGKVLTIKSQPDDDPIASWETPTSVTVDQTYNAASTNAQSGTAVAQAISGISMDEVPDVTSSDDGKVLKASYSGGVGSYAWGTESGGTGSDDVFVAEYGVTSWADINAAFLANKALFAYYNGHTYVMSDMVYSGGLKSVTFANVRSDERSSDNTGISVWFVKAQSTGTTWSFPDHSAGYLVNPPDDGDEGKVLTAKNTFTTGSNFEWATPQGGGTTYTAGNMINISNQNAIGVSTTAGITDIQMVSALPANPVATVLYLIPAT